MISPTATGDRPSIPRILTSQNESGSGPKFSSPEAPKKYIVVQSEISLDVASSRHVEVVKSPLKHVLVHLRDGK